MIAQVLGEIFDLGRKDGDLDLRRTGVGVVGAELLDEVLFLGCAEHREVDFMAPSESWELKPVTQRTSLCINDLTLPSRSQNVKK